MVFTKAIKCSSTIEWRGYSEEYNKIAKCFLEELNARDVLSPVSFP